MKRLGKQRGVPLGWRKHENPRPERKPKEEIRQKTARNASSPPNFPKTTPGGRNRHNPFGFAGAPCPIHPNLKNASRRTAWGGETGFTSTGFRISTFPGGFTRHARRWRQAGPGFVESTPGKIGGGAAVRIRFIDDDRSKKPGSAAEAAGFMHAGSKKKAEPCGSASGECGMPAMAGAP
jgi:hypothetical protein